MTEPIDVRSEDALQFESDAILTDRTVKFIVKPHLTREAKNLVSRLLYLKHFVRIRVLLKTS